VRLLQGRSHRPNLPLLRSWVEGSQVLSAPAATLLHMLNLFLFWSMVVNWLGNVGISIYP
jgi:hypothetical protein